MDDDRPGWGILATGSIAEAFVSDLRTAGRRVTAVGSRTTAAAQEFAGRLDIPTAHGSWDALAEDPDVDVVYIATPHPFHAEAALLMLEHGKHVLVEKPFTLNARQAEEVLALAAERGLIALEAMWTRWLPHMLEIRDLLAAGAIGEPQLLLADHLQALPTDPGHRMNAPELGGGALLDLGVYPVSFAIDVFGEPTGLDVTAAMTATGVDGRVSGTLLHRGGARSVFATALDLVGSNRAAICGTEGVIDIDPVWYTPTSYTVRDAEGRVVHRSHPPIEGRGMQFQALEVERLLREGDRESPRLTAAGTLEVMRTLDRIRSEIGLVYPQEADAAGEA